MMTDGPITVELIDAVLHERVDAVDLAEYLGTATGLAKHSARKKGFEVALAQVEATALGLAPGFTLRPAPTARGGLTFGPTTPPPDIELRLGAVIDRLVCPPDGRLRGQAKWLIRVAARRELLRVAADAAAAELRRQMLRPPLTAEQRRRLVEGNTT